MKSFKEIKQGAKELKAKAKIFVTEHESEIKSYLAFAAGVVVTTVIHDKLYGIENGSRRRATVTVDEEHEKIGIQNEYFNKNGKIRKQLTEMFVFDSPGGAMEFADNLIDAAKRIGYVREEKAETK